MLLRKCLTFFLASSLLFSTACVHPPKVNFSVVDESGFVFKDYTVWAFDAPEVERAGIGCVASDDLYRLTKGCKMGYPVSGITFCFYDYSVKRFACSDSSIREIKETLSWGCLTAREWNQLLTYCKRRMN